MVSLRNSTAAEDGVTKNSQQAIKQIVLIDVRSAITNHLGHSFETLKIIQ